MQRCCCLESSLNLTDRHDGEGNAIDLCRMDGMNVEQQSLVLQVVPPRSASNRDIAALETVMHGLALDVRHPVALEIARTTRGRQFLLRATSPAALEHLAAQ